MRVFSIFCLLLVLLSGCAGEGEGVGSSVYVLPAKAGGRLCAIQCRNAFDKCADGCKLEERSCVNDMQRQAIKDYESYAQEQFKARQPVELHPSDFERLEICEPVRCLRSCRPMYRSCFEKCGGKVPDGAADAPLPFEERK